MKKYVELIELLEKIFGKGAVSRTIGTRTNVVRFPKGKQPIDPTRAELDVEGTAAKNPDLVQTIENSIEDRMGDITKMNDQELLTYTANVRRLANFKEPPPLPEADVIKFGSGQEIKGKGLEELIEKQGTVNPPTTVAGQLETQGKKLEKVGEDLKEITEQKPESVIGDIMKDYGKFQKVMQDARRTGYVRATVRQIMREDIQAGKLKLPKELQDQVMQGLGEPIDIYRKVYGEGALEQIDSLADDLGQFRTEEEAAKFAKSKFTFEPKAEPIDESKTYEELENIFKKGPDEPEGKADGGIIGYANGGRIGFQEGGDIRNVIKEFEKEGTTPSSIAGPRGIEFKLVTGQFSGKPVYKAFYPKDYDFSKFGAIHGSTGSEFQPEYFFKHIMAPEGTYFDYEKNDFLPINSTPEVPTVDPFSGQSVSAQDQEAIENINKRLDYLKSLDPNYLVSGDAGGMVLEDAIARQQETLNDILNKYTNQSNIPTIDPFSGQQVSAQDQAAFTQPQQDIFPQQELPTVTPEAPFQPYQAGPSNVGIFAGPSYDKYSEARTDAYANAPSKFDYDIAANQAAGQFLQDRAKEIYGDNIFGKGIGTLGAIAGVPLAFLTSPGHEAAQVIAEGRMQPGSGVGGFYDAFMNELPFSTAANRAAGVLKSVPGIGEPIYQGAYKLGEGLANLTSTPFTPNVQEAEALKSRYNQYLSAAAPGGSDVLYSQFKKNLEGKADGGRIGFSKGKKVKSQIDKLIEQLNKKTKGKKSMESVDPKTGEVTVPKRPIRRAEEPTGTTVMDPEPEIVDEKSVSKVQQKTKVKKYNDDIIKAADEIYPNYDDPKIAADQIVDSYAQMKFGLEDQYGLSNKERMDLYTQAYDYVMDYNRGAIRKTAGESINISDPKTAEAFTNFARENDPEGFKKIQKIVDDINNKNALEEFDIKDREPNANGGIAGLL